MTVPSLSFRLAVGTLTFATLLSAPATAADPEPAKVIETFHATLLQVMKEAGTLGYEGRYRALAPAIGKAFHLRSMSRTVAGRRNWKRFSTAEKNEFASAFSDLVAATYAHRFDGYSGQSFRVLETASLRPDTVLVKTRVDGTQQTRPGRRNTKLNYLVRRFDGGWRAIDIYLKGSISEVATKRSEYASILRKRGVGELVKEIRKKVAFLRAEASRAPAPPKENHDS
ncbi:MAG: ABC transporter substrate-binding protein [Defluviicoccus sp.]|nr:ABC transporter substrate-binding protein [Defluviicoccus sp.]